MAEIIWTPQSEEDLRGIYDYIAKDSERYALIQIESIITRSDILRKWPRSGKKVVELNDTAIRELVIGNYRLIYRIVNKKRVDILTVHHGARQFPYELIEPG